jgi:hypothetical protein
MENLLDALCRAFDQDSLDQMLRLRLDKDRVQLAGSGVLRTVVFKVILIAVREGWHADLIRAAVSYNPDNIDLLNFCRDHDELMVKADDPVPTVAIGPKAKKWAGPSKAFAEDRQRIYKEMWERVERLNVEGRLHEILEQEFSRRIAEINVFLLTSNVYIDDADRKLVNSYARAARAFHEAVRCSGEAAKLALGETADISEEVIQRASAIGETQAAALAFRASLLEKVRAVVSGRSD